MSDIPKPESERAKDNASTLVALQDEIHQTQDAQKSRSMLRWAIDAITSPYHHSSQAFDNLQRTANSLNGSADKRLTAAETAEINTAIADNRAARQREQDAYGITSGVLKTAGMFTPGRLGFWATGAVFASDEIKQDDPRFTDAGLGLAKGWTSRGIALSMMERGFNPAVMTVGLGTSGRLVDTALTRSNYTDQSTGELSMSSVGAGLLRIGERTLDPHALVIDAGTGVLSYGLIKSTGGLLDGNKFRTVASTGFLTGYAGGMTEELSRQHQTGEYDTARLFAYPLARAASSAVASLPGAQRQYVQNWPWEQAARTRDAEYRLVSISGADVKRIASEKTPVDVTVRTVHDKLALGAEDTLRVGQQKVPIDWISLMHNKITGKAHGISDAPDQLRFVSRPTPAAGQTPEPWSMVVRPGFRSIPDLVASEEFYLHSPDVMPMVSRFAEPATRFLSSGCESGAILLANGTVMKISKLAPDRVQASEDWGRAPGDAKLLHPLLSMPSNPGQAGSENFVGYLQEYVETPTSYAKAEQVMRDMESRGYKLTDYEDLDDGYYPHKQMGTNGIGNTVVIDYGARTKITD